MSDLYIPGVPCWVDSAHPDPAAAAAFYGELFGWQLEEVMPADAPGRYFIARLGDADVAAIGSPGPGAPAVATWNSYIWVDDADATAAKVNEAGGTVVMAPMDVTDAGRTAVCRDREGAPFFLWQAGRHRGATLVNEPGALTLNTLSTRDPGAAADFYGAVFGWDLVDMGTEAGWALPAYGEFNERRSPGVRARMRELGAPERAIEVVAGVTSTDVDRPAHWSVTFKTADPDATADRATALGGRVIEAPHDAPWARVAVIADPQDAVFSVSQFVLENRG